MEAMLYSALAQTVNTVTVAVPFSGFVFGWSLASWSSTPEENETRRMFWFGLAATAGLLGPGAYFGLPWLTETFAFRVAFPDWHLWAHLGGTVGGVVGRFGWMRYVSPWFNRRVYKAGVKSALERDGRTDVRTVAEMLPDSGKPFAVEKHLSADPKKAGMFVGLDPKGKPLRIPYEKWRSSHVQIVGTTGAGKGVASAVLLAQALRAGEAVFTLDPKDDEWAPHVLREAAEAAGVPFLLIDLNRPSSQLDLLAEITPAQLDELLTAGFSLAEKGEAADFYRIGDRQGALTASEFTGSAVGSVRALALAAMQSDLIDKKASAGFIGKLNDLARVDAISAPGGVNMAETIREGGCVYVIGSMRNPRVVMAQRMILVRLLQLVESRDRIAGPVRPVCVFLDEVKYHLSRAALEGLGAARDKGMHLVLAHQSLDDLRDCPADLDGDAVVGAVVENCALRLVYRVQNPKTATWLSEMSGQILVDDELKRIERNAAGADLMNYDRTVRQAERYLVDNNMLLNLPHRVAVVYGSGMPQFAHICPLKADKKPLEFAELAPLESPAPAKPEQVDQPAEPAAPTSEPAATPGPAKAASLAASLIDVGDIQDELNL